MRRGRKIAISIAAAVWMVLLGFTVYYIYGFYTSVSQPIPTSEVYEQKRISPDGTSFPMEDGDVVSFEANDNDYALKVYGIQTSKARFVVNNFLYFEMDVGRDKKIDLEGDGYYDLLVRLRSIQGSQTMVSVSLIEEARSLGGGINDAVGRIGSDDGTQSKMVVLILLLFALILLAYVTKEYIIPTIDERRKMSRKSEIETFNDLHDKYEDAKREGDIEKARRIYHKALHLHRYMDDADQKKTKKAIIEMTNYLK